MVDLGYRVLLESCLMVGGCPSSLVNSSRALRIAVSKSFRLFKEVSNRDFEDCSHGAQFIVIGAPPIVPAATVHVADPLLCERSAFIFNRPLVQSAQARYPIPRQVFPDPLD